MEPKRFLLVHLDAEKPLPEPAKDGIVAWDRSADSAGAPQRVEALHRLLSSDVPVWYGGGLETVHIAELVLGLGCRKVIVGSGFFKTERMPTHFVQRLGDRVVPLLETEQHLAAALDAGTEFGYTRSGPIAAAAAPRLQLVTEGSLGVKPWGIAE